MCTFLQALLAAGFRPEEYATIRRMLDSIAAHEVKVLPCNGELLHMPQARLRVDSTLLLAGEHKFSTKTSCARCSCAAERMRGMLLLLLPQAAS